VEAEIIIPVILSPFVSAIVAIWAARFGVIGQIRHAELLEKRLKILTDLNKLALSQERNEAIRREAEVILEDVLRTSARFDIERVVEWRNKSFLRRFLTLPRPHGTGWLFTAIFYVYLVTGLLYLILLPKYLLEESIRADEIMFLFIGAFGSAGICFLARKGALWLARNQILAERSKLVLAKSDLDAASV
jgi:hypothetical protein